MTTPRETIPNLAELDIRIETQRLVLRPFVETDAEDLWPTVSDPAFPRMMSWDAHKDLDATRAFIRGTNECRVANTAAVWCIEHAGKAAGTIGLDTQWKMAAARVDRGEIGYWLATELWNRGLATEAVIAVMKFAFDTLGLHKLTIRCFADNAASRRVIEKCVFRFIGRAEQDVYRNGQWWAQLHYEMLASEWSDTTNTLRFSRPRAGQ